MNEEELRQEIKRTLTKVNLFPFESAREKWEILTLKHDGGKGKNQNYQKVNEAMTRGTRGIYVYKKKGSKEYLYVGMGDLRGRIKAHYRESHAKPKAKDRGKQWYKFFGAQERQGEMTIFWKEMDGRKAKVIEQMLAYALDPEWERRNKS